MTRMIINSQNRRLIERLLFLGSGTADIQVYLPKHTGHIVMRMTLEKTEYSYDINTYLARLKRPFLNSLATSRFEPNKALTIENFILSAAQDAVHVLCGEELIT